MRLLLLRHIILLPCHHHKIQGYNLIGPIQWPEIDLNSSSSNCAAERKLVNMKPCARTEHKSNSFYWPDLIHAPQWQAAAGQEENAICLNGRVIKLNTLCFIIITVRSSRVGVGAAGEGEFAFTWATLWQLFRIDCEGISLQSSGVHPLNGECFGRSSFPSIQYHTSLNHHHL